MPGNIQLKVHEIQNTQTHHKSTKNMQEHTVLIRAAWWSFIFAKRFITKP